MYHCFDRFDPTTKSLTSYAHPSSRHSLDLGANSSGKDVLEHQGDPRNEIEQHHLNAPKYVKYNDKYMDDGDFFCVSMIPR